MKEVSKCKKDITYFTNNYCNINNLGEIKSLKLYDKQSEVLKSLLNDRNIFLMGDRQTGKTTLLAIYSIFMCLFNSNVNIAFISPNIVTSQNFLDIIRTIYQNLSQDLKLSLDVSTKSSLMFANKSKIVITKDDRGLDNDTIVLVDECFLCGNVDLTSLLTMKYRKVILVSSHIDGLTPLLKSYPKILLSINNGTLDVDKVTLFWQEITKEDEKYQ